MTKIEPATTYGAIVGSILERERSALKLTQSDVADAVGIGTSTWSRIEKGESSLSVDQLKLAASKLGLKPGKILDKAEEAEITLESRGITVFPGTQAGAIVGNFIPVVGTVLGAIIGAHAGAVAGASMGSFWKTSSKQSSEAPKKD